MEKYRRRSLYVKRFFSDSVLPFFRRQRQTQSGEFTDDSLHQSQRGRLEVLSRSVRMPSVPSKLSLGNDDGEGNDTEAGEQKVYETTQFRLSNRKPTNTLATNVLGALGIQGSDAAIYDDSSGHDNQCSCCGFEPNTYVTRYLHWTFRQSFVTVFFSAALAFYGGILFFALLLLWSGRTKPECIYVNGVNFGNGTDSSAFRDFGDAFQLSWTNFATVVRHCFDRLLLYTSIFLSTSNTIPCVPGLRFDLPDNVYGAQRSKQMRFHNDSLCARSFRRSTLWQFLWRNYVWKSCTCEKHCASRVL